MKEYTTTVGADNIVGESYTGKDGKSRVRDVSFFDLILKCGNKPEKAVQDCDANKYED